MLLKYPYILQVQQVLKTYQSIHNSISQHLSVKYGHDLVYRQVQSPTFSIFKLKFQNNAQNTRKCINIAQQIKIKNKNIQKNIIKSLLVQETLQPLAKNVQLLHCSFTARHVQVSTKENASTQQILYDNEPKFIYLCKYLK